MGPLLKRSTCGALCMDGGQREQEGQQGNVEKFSVEVSTMTRNGGFKYLSSSACIPPGYLLAFLTGIFHCGTFHLEITCINIHTYLCRHI